MFILRCGSCRFGGFCVADIIVERETECEDCSDRTVVGHTYLTAVHVDVFACDVKPDAAACPVFALFSLKEALEDAFLCFGGDAGSGVGYAHSYLRVVAVYFNSDRTTVRCILECVGQQIVENFFEFCLIVAEIEFLPIAFYCKTDIAT